MPIFGHDTSFTKNTACSINVILPRRAVQQIDHILCRESSLPLPLYPGLHQKTPSFQKSQGIIGGRKRNTQGIDDLPHRSSTFNRKALNLLLLQTDIHFMNREYLPLGSAHRKRGTYSGLHGNRYALL
jgi:hypothetical protein